MLKGQRGVATVEFYIVALFALLPLCLGGLELALLMGENHHLDHAAFQAARHAAMTHGDLDSARRALATAATVLFVDAREELDRGNVATRVARGYAAALADQVRFSRLRIIREPEKRGCSWACAALARLGWPTKRCIDDKKRA